jgi:hypothetical protein
MLGMGSLTQRDAAANVLQPLFEHSVLRADEDCPRTLVSPVPPIQNLNKEAINEIDQPLPASGNWVGFLNILLKTELEMCHGDESAQAKVVKNFQQITTTSAAKAYIQTMGARIEALRNNGRA